MPGRKTVFRAVFSRWPQFALPLLLHIVLFTAVCALFFLPISLLLRFFLAFLAVLFVLFPHRFIVARRLCKYFKENSQAKQTSYFQLVLAGILRLLTGSLWSIPLLVCTYLLYRWIFVMDASSASAIMANIGKRLSFLRPSVNPYSLGIDATFFLTVFSLLLSLYGWHRGVPFDHIAAYAPNAFEAYKESRKARKHLKKTLAQNGAISFLLFLPALIGGCCTLISKFGGISKVLMASHLAITSGVVMQPDAFLKALVIFILLYMPLLPYRKALFAATMVDYEQNNG